MFTLEDLTIENLRKMSLTDPILYRMFTMIDSGIIEKEKGLIYALILSRHQVNKLSDILCKSMEESIVQDIVNNIDFKNTDR